MLIPLRTQECRETGSQRCRAPIGPVDAFYNPSLRLAAKNISSQACRQKIAKVSCDVLSANRSCCQTEYRGESIHRVSVWIDFLRFLTSCWLAPHLNLAALGTAHSDNAYCTEPCLKLRSARKLCWETHYWAAKAMMYNSFPSRSEYLPSIFFQGLQIKYETIASARLLFVLLWAHQLIEQLAYVQSLRERPGRFLRRRRCNPYAV